MVHVRHGDYMKLQKFHCVQPFDYYETARDRIEDGVHTYSQLLKYGKDDLVYVIFSDDIEWCQREFAERWPSKTCVYIDKSVHAKCKANPTLKGVPIDVCEMMLMTFSTHAIIANSSFSWWGAYLMRSPNKLVMAPSKWLVDEEKNKDALHIIDRNMYVI